jgi:hypothetical protein
MPQRTQTTGTTEPSFGSSSGSGSEKAIVPAVAVAAAAGRAADEWRLRQDLDKIDELDESNPFGSALHHGGPYEAISKFVEKNPASKENGRLPQNQVRFSIADCRTFVSLIVPTTDYQRTKFCYVW